MREQSDLSMIAGTLKHGEFSGESAKKILIAFIIFSVVLFAGMIFSVIMLSIDQYKNPGSIVEFVIALISIIGGILLVWIIILVIINKNEKIRKEILLWIEDAIELKAYSKKIGIDNSSILFSTVKIQVDFDLEGVHYSRMSHAKHFGTKLEGYDNNGGNIQTRKSGFSIQGNMTKLWF